MRTVSGLLRFRPRGINKEDDEQHSISNLELALDFVTTYSNSIISALSHSPRNNVKYTWNSLETASDCLELIGVCLSTNLSRFKQSAPSLFDIFCSAAKTISVDISSFLGSGTASRFLFKQDNRYSGRNNYDNDYDDHEMMAARNRNFSSQVQHEAIAHSHYVSTSVYAMSNDERAMLCDEKNCGGCSNVFAYKMEILLAKNLFFALTVIAQSNPISEGFVHFSSDEVRRLGPALTSMLSVNTVVGVREETASFMIDVRENEGDCGDVGVSFGTILNVYDNDTVDVKYNDTKSVENSISVARISWIQDKSVKQTPSFDFAVTGTSASDYRETGMCIGHLGLALRWCMDSISWNNLPQKS